MFLEDHDPVWLELWRHAHIADVCAFHVFYITCYSDEFKCISMLEASFLYKVQNFNLKYMLVSHGNPIQASFALIKCGAFSRK